MKKVTVELDWDTVDNIVKTELQSAYESLKQDMENRSQGRGFPIFHTDEEKDFGEIAEHVYCLQKVLSYWGLNVK